MKITRALLQGAVVFAAGVGCTVIAQVAWTPPPSSHEELVKRTHELLVEVSHYGAYVSQVRKGSVWFMIDPIRCPTPIPPPKMPAYAVDPTDLQQGVAALLMVNEAYRQGVKNPMRDDDKCHLEPVEN